MKALRKSLWGALAIFWASIGGLMVSQAVRAQAPAQTVLTRPLVPAASPGFVEVSAVVVEAEAQCEGASCRIAVTQNYYLHNRDRVKPASIRVKLAASSSEAKAEATYQATFKGAPLAPGGEATLWEVQLAPDEQGVFQVLSQHEAGANLFLEWAWDMSALVPWGQIVGARLVWRLPEHMTDDAFLDVQPPANSFDGRALTWEFEALTAPPRFHLTMISPPIWRELRTLEDSGDHLALAKRYLALEKEAAERGFMYPDPFAKVLAELQSALADGTDPTEVHTLLADLYRRRAEARPELRLNYLVLAAREYEALRALRPADAEVTRRLSQTLFDAALAASAEGDPAGALDYVREAEAADALALPPGDVERLMLKWAVELALGGRAPQALKELEGILSPGLRESLFRYAPPLTFASTKVFLSQGERRVSYRLGLYESSAENTRQRLQRLAARLREIPNVQVDIQASAEGTSLEITLGVHWEALSDLYGASEAIVKACAAEEGFLAALMAAPWRGDIAYEAVRPSWWASEWHYEEAVDLAEVASAWEAEALYSHWHLIEVRNEAPLDERSSLEKQLALAVLSDQAHVWDSLPSACAWAYHVSAPDGAPAEGLSWPIRWGETTRLLGGRRAILWERLALLGGFSACALGLVGLIWTFRRHS